MPFMTFAERSQAAFQAQLAMGAQSQALGHTIFWSAFVVTRSDGTERSNVKCERCGDTGKMVTQLVGAPLFTGPIFALHCKPAPPKPKSREAIIAETIAIAFKKLYAP